MLGQARREESVGDHVDQVAGPNHHTTAVEADRQEVPINCQEVPINNQEVPINRQEVPINHQLLDDRRTAQAVKCLAWS